MRFHTPIRQAASGRASHIAAAVVSAPRLPGFDGHRSKFLDGPLSGFDAVVNLTVLNGERALWAIIAGAMHRVDFQGTGKAAAAIEQITRADGT